MFAAAVWFSSTLIFTFLMYKLLCIFSMYLFRLPQLLCKSNQGVTLSAKRLHADMHIKPMIPLRKCTTLVNEDNRFFFFFGGLSSPPTKLKCRLHLWVLDCKINLKTWPFVCIIILLRFFFIYQVSQLPSVCAIMGDRVLCRV